MESANQSSDAAASASATAAADRLLVDESSSDRKRFQIELKQGETTIVSWAKLLKDAGIPVDQPQPSSPERPKWLHREDESSSECSNIALKKKKNEQKSHTTEHCQTRKRNVFQATKNAKIGHARVIIGHARVKSITLTSHISEERSFNKTRIKLPDLNVPYTVQEASALPTHIKDESSGVGSVSLLESTILDMEMMVAVSRRSHGDVEDAEHSVATKSRLPRELKKKLEAVARLAHSSQGRISDELIMRLMSILGNWLKPKTLKRFLRNIVQTDLSESGWDAVKFTQIKKEVVHMIKLRNPITQKKDGPGYENMELHAARNAKYSMDHGMEDKICDFYDIYVRGMDEIKISEIRKFYIQLAALWPKGTMDNHGIRNAICRSKERRRITLQEKGKQKKSSTATAGVNKDLHGEANLLVDSDRPVNDHNAPVLTFPEALVPGTPELDQNLSAAAKRFSPPSAGSCQNLFKKRQLNNLRKIT